MVFLHCQKAPEGCSQISGYTPPGAFAEEVTSETHCLPTPSHPDFGVVTSPDSILETLGAFWSHSFDLKLVEGECVSDVLCDYKRHKQWDWSEAEPPTYEGVKFYVQHLGDCMPGVDGIINAAFKYGTEHTVKYCYDLVWAHLNGKEDEIPDELNEGLFVFPSKVDGTQGGASPDVLYVHPSETRPLTLKVSDNKIVAGVLNHSLAPVVAKNASKLQNGFVLGRQLVQNVVDLDYYSREHAMCDLAQAEGSFDSRNLKDALPSLISGLPLAVMFDFAAAFPSVAHAWLSAVLDAISIAGGLMNAIRKLHKGNKGYGSSKGGHAI